MLEAELREPVAQWLFAQNLMPVHEVHLWHMVDIVGVAFEERIGRRIPPVSRAIAVELKLSDIKGVCVQAKANVSWVHASYAAMPVDRIRTMRESTREEKFWDLGIGLLAVHGNGQVTEEIPPSRGGEVPDRLRLKLWRRTR